MTFRRKTEGERVTGASVLIPVPLSLRRRVEQIAEREGLSLGEIGRRALRSYLSDLPEERARERRGVPR